MTTTSFILFVWITGMNMAYVNNDGDLKTLEQCQQQAQEAGNAMIHEASSLQMQKEVAKRLRYRCIPDEAGKT